MTKKRKPSIMFAATDYGHEDEIRTIATCLKRYGYNVVNSLIGTLPNDSSLSNMDNCVNAVQDCDLFFGLIHTDYGSGNIGDKNITREEFRKAVTLDKPRWGMVAELVVTARNVVNHLCLASEVKKKKEEQTDVRSLVTMRKNSFLDYECIGFYDEMVQSDKPAEERVGNWIQPYRTQADILEYIKTNLWVNKKKVLEKLEKTKTV